jgi:hypothetical protein
MQMVDYTPARLSYILVVPNQRQERKWSTSSNLETSQLRQSQKTIVNTKYQEDYMDLAASASPDKHNPRKSVTQVYNSRECVGSFPTD